MDPVIGRWTTIDPYVEAGQETGTPYGYVFDDPMKYTDPDGRAPDITIEGENNSSVTVKTDLVNVTVSVPIDLHGNHTISGEKALQTGLDIVSMVDPTGLASAVSGAISLKNGEYFDATISFLGAIPLVGKLADATKIEKDVKMLDEAVKDISKLEQRAEKLSKVDRAGKDFTKAGKDAVKDLNAAENGGKMKCTTCGADVESGVKHETGVTPPDNEAHVDHIKKKREGGSGTPKNGRVRCRKCNIGDQ
jgi:hypothetical protein